MNQFFITKSWLKIHEEYNKISNQNIICLTCSGDAGYHKFPFLDVHVFDS